VEPLKGERRGRQEAKEREAPSVFDWARLLAHPFKRRSTPIRRPAKGRVDATCLFV